MPGVCVCGAVFSQPCQLWLSTQPAALPTLKAHNHILGYCVSKLTRSSGLDPGQRRVNGFTLNMSNLLIIWKVFLVLFKIPVLVHQISLWLTSQYCITWHSAGLKLSIYTSAFGALMILFSVKLEILKQPYSNMHALSFFLKSRISCYFIFLKKVPNIFFIKKEKKESKIPLLLYATAKIGEMALAYLKCFV